MLNNEDKRTIEILIAKIYRFSRTRAHDAIYSSQWVDDVVSLQNILNQFRIDTVDFRQSNVFRSFSAKFEIVASSSASSSSSFSVFRVQLSNEQFFVFKLDISIRFGISTAIQSETSTSSKFRRNSNSEIRDSIFSSLASSYSLITNFDFDLNASRQFIVDSDITNNERRSVSTQTDNSQTFFNSQTSFFTQIEKIRRTMFSIQLSSKVDQVFWNDIMIVIIVFASVFRFATETFSFADNNILQSAVKFVENVNYFDSDYENSIDTNQLIVSFDRHNFYRDVFIFIDHFKNLKKISFDFRIKELMSICLKNDALTWYNAKLIEIEKNFFRKANIERWCTHFIKRFKKRTSIALKKLQIENYIYVDARRERKSRVYMQNIFRHVRVANFSSVFHQCITVWNNLELNFRAQILESSENIILITFLSQLNAKKNVWMNMTTRHRDQVSNSDFSNNADRSNRFSKQNRAKNADFSQQFYVNFSSQAYMWSSSSYNFYQYRNSIYQAQSIYQFRQFTESYQQKFFDSFSTVLPAARQSFLLKFSNEFASASNRKSNRSNVKRFEKSDKAKVYNVDENNEIEKVEKNYFDEKNVDDYHVSENISYYQSNFYNDLEDENDNVVYLITSEVLSSKSNKITICRKCSNDFSFNNKLHEHFRFDCSDKASLIYSADVSNQFSSTIMTTQDISVVTRNSIKKLLTISKSNEFTSSSITQSRIEVIDSDSTIVSKTSKSFTNVHFDFSERAKFASIFIIVSDVDFSKNVDTDHDFRNWIYARIHVIFSSTIEVESICLDIDVDITLCDRQFFKKQVSNVLIRIMTISISVRDLDVDKHMTVEYVILSMYFSDQKNDNSIRVKITKEIHLIDNLKTNMLFGNNVIESEKIDVNIFKKTIYIESCEVTASLEIRTFKVAVQISIHARKITVIFFRFELVFSMHYTIVSFDRDYLFESNELKLSLYVHLIDFNTKQIIVRNESNQFVHIFRNYRVDHIIEINYINVFQVHVDEISHVVDLALRRSAQKHKISWFKKVIVAIYVAINVLSNSSFFIFEIIVVTVAISKVFHSSILSQRQIFSELNVQFSSICYSDFQSLAFISETSAISDLKNTKSKSDLKLSTKIIFDNDVIIHRFSDDVVQIITKLMSIYFDIWKDTDFVKLFQKNWMRISLKSNWKQRIFDKAKIYSLNKKNRKLVDETFDKLHESDKLNWIDEFISFSYSVFCVWKEINDKKKNRFVVNIRDFNAIIQSNVYFLSLQFDIISIVLECQYIIVLNCSIFFYQWRIHSDDRHKLTVITHRDQENFNVIVMNYKNFFVYVQR